MCTFDKQKKTRPRAKVSVGICNNQRVARAIGTRIYIYIYVSKKMNERVGNKQLCNRTEPRLDKIALRVMPTDSIPTLLFHLFNLSKLVLSFFSHNAFAVENNHGTAIRDNNHPIQSKFQ